ncbi:MAG: sigma-70 family RNA polymerase sigma factor [Firmicutes bacterium]|nr:sigma-70 family RNA polymerase sigma factor [Bacillota bacterium]
MGLSKAEIEEITNRHYDDIYKFCVSKTKDIDVASDITQEAFLALFKKADKLRNINIRAWLYKTAGIQIKAYFRNQKHENEQLPLEDCEDMETTQGVAETISEEEFEALLTKAQKKILSVLTEDEKKVFIKLYIEKKTVRVVSEELGITENNVYVKSHRIKKKSKKIISTVDLLIRVLAFKYL